MTPEFALATGLTAVACLAIALIRYVVITIPGEDGE
jgi:hypothetical protein